jgi:hypothetical protein
VNDAWYNINLPGVESLQGPLRITLQDIIFKSSFEGTAVRVSLPQLLTDSAWSSQTASLSSDIAEVAPNKDMLRALEYPPVGLTALTTTLSGQAYGNGTYAISASPLGNWTDPWRLFDRVINSVTIADSYNFNSGFPNNLTYTLATNGTNYWGEWVDLTLPEPIHPVAYVVNPGPDGARQTTQHTLLGSPDGGTTWVHLHSKPYGDVEWTFYTYPVSSDMAFSQFRLVLERAGEPTFDSFRSFARFDEWRMVGSPSKCDTRLGIVCESRDTSVFNRPFNIMMAAATTIPEYTCRLTVQGGERTMRKL